jgi:hypothetical protein
VRSAAQNERQRVESPPKPRDRKQACKNFHEFTPENTITDGRGRRACRECARERVRTYRSREDKQVQYRIDVCKHGHAMDEENSHVAADGTRSCRACSRERARESYQRTQSHRGTAPGERTHCTAGHIYDEANTYVTSKGHRQCRTCNKARDAARARRKSEPAPGSGPDSLF